MVGLLIRHGHCDAVGQWLAGRAAGIALSTLGERQAAEVAAGVRWLPITAVYSSPLERAHCTAAAIARDRGLPVHTREAFTDLDFGAWTGKRLAELAGDARWSDFNRDRCNACAPGGEALRDMQRRVVDELVRLGRTHRGELVAIVTHAEAIRCAIAAFDGRTLDDVASIDISPAHVSAIGLESDCRRVLAVNLRADEIAV